jgi:hypothetical protein
MTDFWVREPACSAQKTERGATLWRGVGFFWPTVIGSVLLWVGAAQADTLRAPPGAPEWQHFAADALLYLHICGGTLGMLSGVGALLSRKGEWAHRFAGNVFFLSMLVTYAIGAGVAPFLSEGQRPNTIAGIMALYLLISGWMTVKRPENTSGRLEVFGLGVAVLVASAGGLFMYMGAHSASGTIDGSPPQAFLVFALAGTFAALGELNVILRGGIAGAARVARHLWRMCFSLFIASGSFFLGQQQVMPEWMRDSPLLLVVALAPLAFMFFWLIRVRLTRWYKGAAVAAAA